MIAPSLLRLDLAGWDHRHAAMVAAGESEPWPYGGALSRWLAKGDRRLARLRFDPSWAGLRLWNFLLSEEDRLRAHRAAGRTLVGTMKDLGTVPVIADALGLVPFYPDGAWWIPCVMELDDRLLQHAERLGIGPEFCPVRAMLGAYATGAHFPLPDLNVCSAGAVCDDFPAIAERLRDLGHQVLFWQIPVRRAPDPDEAVVALADGTPCPASLVAACARELRRVGEALAWLAGMPLDPAALRTAIARANAIRATARALRAECARAPRAPLPALELMIADMLTIHFCSDIGECPAVLAGLLAEVRARVAAGAGVLAADAVPVFWLNPPADLAALPLLEELGGRLVGADFMVGHALLAIPEDDEPFTALARCALADPLVGGAQARARAAVAAARAAGARALVIARIPGASHCAWEGEAARAAAAAAGLPAVELEIPPVLEPVEGRLRTRLEALLEMAR